MQRYYIIRCTLDQMDSYLIWFSNDQDGLMTDDAHQIIVFRDQISLQDYAQQIGVQLVDEPPVDYDFDTIQHWLHDPRAAPMDYPALLDAWNLFTDIATSVGMLDTWQEPTWRTLYDKLFWANNLPAVTPPGKTYEPIWSDAETAMLRTVMYTGLQLLRDNVQMNG